MCIVIRGYCGLGRGKDGGGGWDADRYKAKAVGRVSGDAGALPECEVMH